MVSLWVRGVRRELLQNVAFNSVSQCSLFMSYELFKKLSSLQWACPGGPGLSVEEGVGGREMRALEGRENCTAQRSFAQARAEEDERGALESEERGDHGAMWHYMAVASAGAGAGMIQVRGSLMLIDQKRGMGRKGGRCTRSRVLSHWRHECFHRFRAGCIDRCPSRKEAVCNTDK